MEKQPTLEIIKPTDETRIANRLFKSAEILLLEYVANGGKDEEYIEYLKGNRPDPRD